MPLKIKVTPAGRAALVNAANTGTLPVLIAQIGVTATGFIATGTELALPGELKRLITFAGAAVADDTIHTTIRDDSADTYTLRGFALYLADGTLFAIYGQADPILEKSIGAVMLLATDIIFSDIDAASLTFGNTDFLNPPATTEMMGVVELATDVETTTGADAVRAVTPKGLLATLDARLGANNPSTFVKSLLDKVSTLAFVTALGIRGAASYDTGTGNGLDADLLDGQHGAYYRSYANLTGIPATFNPSVHNHSATNITSGTLSVARGGTGIGTFTAGGYLVGNGTAAIAIKTPAQVLANIGAAPVAHSHPIDNINGLQTALDARPLQATVTSQISSAVNALIDGAPGAIDTLNELAAAMGDDPNFAATTTNAIAQKAPKVSPSFTGNGWISGLFTAGPAIIGGPNGLEARFAVTFDTWYFFQNGLNAGFYDGATNNYLIRFAKTTKQVSCFGGLDVVGALSCLTFNATSSDIRLKDNIEPTQPRPLHRLIAELPDSHGAFVSYTHRVDQAHRLGVIAQDMERVEPAYMGTVDITEDQVMGIAAGTYKTVDKASAAYEQSMWAGQEIDRLHATIASLQARLTKLEAI